MSIWPFERLLKYMQDQGVEFAPRIINCAIKGKWQDASGLPPFRDAKREVRVMERYLSTLPGAYRSSLHSLNKNLPHMTPSCRVCVLLPCRGENRHIPGILNLLAEQFDMDGKLLPRDSYEVILLCNTRTTDERDGSDETARRWKHPAEMILHVLEYTHPDSETAPLTMARKILADLAVMRAVERKGAESPLFFASEDADILWMDPVQIAHMTKALDSDPGLDCVRGQQDRCPWLMIKHPILFLMRRSWNFSEARMSRPYLRPDNNPDYDFQWNRTVTSGWNTMFTAESYAMIGGYTRERVFEEDMDIGEKISCLRSYNGLNGVVPQVNTVGRVPSRSEGSPRRWLYHFAKGIEPYASKNNYDNFFGQQHEKIIKSNGLEHLGQAIFPLTSLSGRNIPLLEDLFQKDLIFLRNCTKSEIRAQEEFARVLRWMGFRNNDAEILDGHVRINSLKSIRKVFADYELKSPKNFSPHLYQANARYRRCWHNLWGKGRTEKHSYGNLMTLRQFGVGLIGCGRIAEEGHLPALSKLPSNIKVIAVADPATQRRSRIGEMLGLHPENHFETMESMFNNASIDVVIVSSPTAFHAEAVDLAFKNGVSVICEKPLAVFPEAAKRLLNIAELKGLKYGVIHNYLYSDLWKAGLGLLQSGILGAPRTFLVKICAPEPLPGFSPNASGWRLRLDYSGRGCLLDQGYHFFYLGEAIFGKPIHSVTGKVGYSGIPGRQVEDFVQVSLSHGATEKTIFTIDWASKKLMPTVYRIDCTHGYVELKEDDSEATFCLNGHPQQTIKVNGTDPSGYSGSLVDSLARMANGNSPVTSANEGLRILEWIDVAYKSAGATGNQLFPFAASPLGLMD